MAIEAKGASHLQGRSDLEVLPDDPDTQLAGHDPAVEIAQPDPQREPREIALLDARLTVHPFGDHVTDLLEQYGAPESHRHVPDVGLTKAAKLAARIWLGVGIVKKAHQVAPCPQGGLHGRPDDGRPGVPLA